MQFIFVVQFTEATKVKTEVQDILLSVIFMSIMLITKRSQYTPIIFWLWSEFDEGMCRGNSVGGARVALWGRRPTNIETWSPSLEARTGIQDNRLSPPPPSILILTPSSTKSLSCQRR